MESPQALTIVGIASDIVQSDRTRQNAEALVYLPYQQRPQPNMFVFARTRVEPAALATEFSAQVYAMDANLPVPGLMPLADRFARAYRFERNMTTVFVVFAALALSLAVVGLYAVVAHSVGTRTREIGIRRALGATTWQIRNLVLSEAAVPLVAGLTIGVSVSVALAPVMEPILVRVSGVDPAILGAASLDLGGRCCRRVPASRSARTANRSGECPSARVDLDSSTSTRRAASFAEFHEAAGIGNAAGQQLVCLQLHVPCGRRPDASGLAARVTCGQGWRVSTSVSDLCR